MNRQPHFFKLLFALQVALGLCAALCLSAQSDETQADTAQSEAVEVETNSVATETAPTEEQGSLVDALRNLISTGQVTNQEPQEMVETNTATNIVSESLPDQSVATNEVHEAEVPSDTAEAPAVTPEDSTSDAEVMTNAAEIQESITETPATPTEEPAATVEIETKPIDAQPALVQEPTQAAEPQPAPIIEPPVATVPPPVVAPAAAKQVEEPTITPLTAPVVTKPAEAPAKPPESSAKAVAAAAEPTTPAPKSDRAKTQQDAKPPAVTNSLAPVVKIPQSVFVVPSNLKEGRDPFFPDSIPVSVSAETNAVVPEVSETGELTLQGISGTADRPLAIINNTTFGQGEMGFVTSGSGRFRIRCVEIKTDSVIVESGGQRQELKLRRNRR